MLRPGVGVTTGAGGGAATESTDGGADGGSECSAACSNESIPWSGLDDCMVIFAAAGGVVHSCLLPSCCAASVGKNRGVAKSKVLGYILRRPAKRWSVAWITRRGEWHQHWNLPDGAYGQHNCGRGRETPARPLIESTGMALRAGHARQHAQKRSGAFVQASASAGRCFIAGKDLCARAAGGVSADDLVLP